MTDEIRLVIWDLDKTYWTGTLSEGGIAYEEAHQRIVEDLASRGIMSSICSKNDVEPVREILAAKGAWDLFVFPSIDWTPKGPRIVDLIEKVQLRPESILFIDDCPRNRAEVQAALPGLKVRSEATIPALLDDPLCIGKPDPKKTRLRQYKLLEKRSSDAAKFVGSNTDFLRASGIQVEIEYDVLANIDRAVELISRTNQLNFTKKRLDPSRAKEDLARDISLFHNQAALIKVSDQYGDYGYCGFYLLNSIHQYRELIHFCFSCRVLGMCVETWLYEQLGRPSLDIVQPVVADLSDGSAVDWIKVGPPSTRTSRAATKTFSNIGLWGGCEIDALEHYLKPHATAVRTETNFWASDTLFTRRDTTTNTLFLLDSPSAPAIQSLVDLGFSAKDLACSLARPSGEDALIVMSCWGDLQLPIYRHKELGFEYCFSSFYGIERWGDITALSDAQIEDAVGLWAGDKALFRVNIHRTLRDLKDKFEFAGPMTLERACRNWDVIASRLAGSAKVAVLLPPRFGFDPQQQAIGKIHNDLIKTILSRHDNIVTIDASDFQDASDRAQNSWQHLDRMVYFRMYQRLIGASLERGGAESGMALEVCAA